MREGLCGRIFPALSFSWLFAYIIPKRDIIYMDGQDGSGLISARLGYGRKVNSMRFCNEKGQELLPIGERLERNNLRNL